MYTSKKMSKDVMFWYLGDHVYMTSSSNLGIKHCNQYSNAMFMEYKNVKISLYASLVANIVIHLFILIIFLQYKDTFRISCIYG